MLGRQVGKNQGHQNICDKPYQHNKSHDMHLVNWNHKYTDQNVKVSTVVISISAGQSYAKQYRNHHILSRIKGEQILVGVAMSFQLPNILKLLKGEIVNIQQYKILAKYIQKVKPQKVVVNWEHSSGYSTQNFSGGKEQSLQIISICLKRGYTQQFSGYSLMTLVKQWQNSSLGKNPFIRVHLPQQRPLQFLFDLNQIKKVQSDQFNQLASLVTSPICVFIPQNGQFCFGRKPNHYDDNYKLHVLSINVSCASEKQQENILLNGVQGSYGHVLLQYKSGARIFCSSGITTQIGYVHVEQKQVLKRYAERLTTQQYENLKKKIQNSSDQQKQMNQLIINLINARTIS